jgi:hypothetical protein
LKISFFISAVEEVETSQGWVDKKGFFFLVTYIGEKD